MRAGCLLSDSGRIKNNLDNTVIGMRKIKDRRLELPVSCHPGTTVGQYVPFYFCPRSIMLYILYRGNDRDIEYRGGQSDIVHLECDLLQVVEWAKAHKKFNQLFVSYFPLLFYLIPFGSILMNIFFTNISNTIPHIYIFFQKYI